MRTALGRHRSVVLAAALFAALTVLRVVVANPGEGVGALYALPIAVIAASHGRRTSMATAALAFVLFAVVVLVQDTGVGLLGFVTRAVLYAGVALIVNGYAQRLREQEGRSRELALIVESSQAAIATADLDGTIRSWNAAAERLTGWPAADAIGRHQNIVLPEEAHGIGDEVLRRIAGAEQLDDMEFELLRRDGTTVDVSLTAAPIFDAESRISGASSIFRDITERRQAEERLRKVLDLAPDPIIAFDRTGRVKLANVATEQVFGWSGDELADLDTRNFFGDLEYLEGEFEQRLAAFFEDPEEIAKTRSGDRIGRRKDGTEFPAEFALSHIPELDGEMLGIMVLRDVTERKAAEEQAERMKSEFFALVSHELRTPLTSIVGYTDVLVDDEAERLSDDGQRFLGVIQRNTKRLDRLVQDLLLVAQVEAGGFEVEFGKVDPEALIRHCLDEQAPAARDAGIELVANGSKVGEFPGDPSRLGQVLDNLLTNAIKFTPEGGTVRIGANERDGNCVFEVADTGSGIGPDEMKHLFDRFYRASAASKGHIKGVGLGLAITKAIVDKHHGEIEIDSEVDRGSTFRVVLPMAAPEELQGESEHRGGIGDGARTSAGTRR